MMPMMYGPYYCWLAVESGGALSLSITFACVLQLALSLSSSER